MDHLNLHISKPSDQVDATGQNQRPYIKPAIIHEYELETKAGSPLKVDPLDPTTWDSPDN